MLTVYTLSNCDTCRKAVKWLRGHEIDFTERAIRETPPSLKELRQMLQAYDGDVRKLFNTAGRDYRDGKVAEKLPTLTADEALKLLAANGNLVKRPFAVGDGVALVGFSESAWASALASR